MNDGTPATSDLPTDTLLSSAEPSVSTSADKTAGADATCERNLKATAMQLSGSEAQEGV